ncbi:MAG TPA: hypothetical protein VM734_11435 [Kofleriaceae bacterium]|nr:hypothetical protein [Kofleriaceae bacterium]
MLDQLPPPNARPSQEPRARPRLAHFVPLIGFLLPSAVIGYGFVLPRNGAAGVNELSIGFATTLLAAGVTYTLGVLAALKR